MINSGYVLTAAEMLAAEEKLINQGTSVEILMEQAGQGAAQQIWRVSHDMPTLVLCGPGNNGGDGYVVAEWLRKKGVSVSVAAACEPKTDAAKNAHSLWQGKTYTIDNAEPKPQVIDCLFGTGLQRPVAGNLIERYLHYCENARKRIAIDVPSGVDSDTGQLLNKVPDFDLTIALGAVKPAHFIEPVRSKMGHIVAVDIGIDAESDVRVLKKPVVVRPKATDHKYTRGMVVVVAGEMPGAAKLTALAAQYSGAGYVKIFASPGFEAPHASIVVNCYESPKELAELLSDQRISVVAIGPGLGRDSKVGKIVDQVLDGNRKLVIDADALTVLGDAFVDKLKNLQQPVIATPHTGEFYAIYNDAGTSKIDATQTLAKASHATILHKGSDTVIAGPIGNSVLSNISCSWLSTAGTGDILTGIVAARLANDSISGFEAAQEGQWLHGRAAQLVGPAFSPEQLIEKIPIAMTECL